MNTKLSLWYALANEGATFLRCAECEQCIDLEGGQIDHHSRVCPKCGVECVYLDWKNCILQVVLPKSPDVIVRAIRLAQQHFDELDYMEFMVAVEQLMDELYSSGRSKPCP